MRAPVIDIRRDGAVEWVTLDRPAVRNAFNDQVVDELSAWAARAAADATLRVVVLGGHGTVFSAGADLDWMARGADDTREAIEQQAETLHALFAAIDTLPQAYWSGACRARPSPAAPGSWRSATSSSRPTTRASASAR